MRGHLQCRDTLAGNEGCPLKTGTTVNTKSNFLYNNVFKEYFFKAFNSAIVLLLENNVKNTFYFLNIIILRKHI